MNWSQNYNHPTEPAPTQKKIAWKITHEKKKQQKKATMTLSGNRILASVFFRDGMTEREGEEGVLSTPRDCTMLT